MIGVDRILLVSDAIFASLTEAVHMVEKPKDLTDAERAAILDHNAQRMLSSPPC